LSKFLPTPVVKEPENPKAFFKLLDFLVFTYAEPFCLSLYVY